MPDVLTDRALNRATLARQSLLERSDEDPVGAVERLVGLQAEAQRLSRFWHPEASTHDVRLQPTEGPTPEARH